MAADLPGGKGPVLYSGGPAFKKVTRWLPPEEWGWPWLGGTCFQAADLDGDGDLDVLAGGFGRLLCLYFNRLRQVTAPYLARIGGKWRLQFQALRGSWNLLPLLAASRGRTPVGPFGLFLLGRKGLLPLPVLSLPSGGPKAREYPIPRNPALLGARFFTQVLFLDARTPGKGRLSNLLEEEILP